MKNILLSGGSGSRLWPLSRTQLPKQFIRLFNNQSLYQETLRRNQIVCSETLVVTHEDHYFLALEQSAENLSPISYLIEPCSRNTAAAITLACLSMRTDDIVLITPADHVINDTTQYEEAINKAQQSAQADEIVIFGIDPSYAETGYGYLECNASDSNDSSLKVNRFHEKPSLAVAKQYLEHNQRSKNSHTNSQFLWNSGMICSKVEVLLTAIKKHAPEIYHACSTAQLIQQDNILKVKQDDMQTIPNDSIDFAVLEKLPNLTAVKCDFDWSDLGSFDALADEFEKQAKTENTAKQHTQDNKNNISVNYTPESKKPFLLNSQNNFIIAQQRPVALVNIDNLHIIDSPDALLIMPRRQSQEIKNLIPQIKNQQPNLLKIPSKVAKPYGYYEVLQKSPGYKVKRIYVKPGGKLSLQKHQFRSEHWVVVSGVATVTLDNKKMTLHPNQSTYIQIGQLHRLENLNSEDLIMIEVQVGNYTGEDDIERFDDHYGRQL